MWFLFLISRLTFGSFSSPILRLDLLDKLTQLEVLKVRSVSGFTLDDGLQAFSQLKELKFLVICTYFPIQRYDCSKFYLESLEIGDCVEWTEAGDYEAVGQLSHLKHLRLEQGPQTSVLQHLESSLKEMPNLQHLEFVNFTIDAPLDALQFSGLKRLLVIPCYSAEVKIFKLYYVKKLE